MVPKAGTISLVHQLSNVTIYEVLDYLVHTLGVSDYRDMFIIKSLPVLF